MNMVGTSWIITLHDLIEVIVGDLPDEDELDWWPNIIKWEGGWYLISGSTPLYEINQFFETDVIEDISGQYSSIAGYVGSQIDDIPKVGDCVTLDLYTCEIVDMDGIKIDKLLFQKRVAEKIDYKEIIAS
jgi:putative hemolysin